MVEPTTTTKGASIRCRNICKKYGDVPVGSGVNLDVKKGSFMAVLGPSGCGKTTMLRMLCGLEKPDFGTIEIGPRQGGGPRIHIPVEQRKVGMVFQEYALFPHMTVEENVGYGLPRNGSRSDRVREVLDLVGLDQIEHLPSELSGGQQQRVALARALAPRPDVILLDEPFSNLDASLRERVRSDVRNILHKAHVTVIFVTHDQEEALSLADTVSVMIDGTILQTGSPQQIYRCPSSHRVATFLGDANFLPGTGQGKEIECELGQLLAEEFRSGNVEVMFRPEDVQVEHDEQGTGTIQFIQYFGHDQLLHIKLNSGTFLRSRLAGSRTVFEPEERVKVTVTSSVMVYPSEYGCPKIPL